MSRAFLPSRDTDMGDSKDGSMGVCLMHTSEQASQRAKPEQAQGPRPNPNPLSLHNMAV